MSSRTTLRLPAALALALLGSGCMVGPNYQRPSAPLAPQFKEADGWTPAHPSDAIPKGAWWSVYNDPVLDGLERRVSISNQNVAQYFAAYRQARQLTKEARAELFPTVNANGSIQDSKSGGRGIGGVGTTGTGLTGTGGLGTTGSGGTTTTTTGTGTGTTIGSGTGSTGSGLGTVITNGAGSVTSYEGLLEASWTPDLWGRIRRLVEEERTAAQAAAGDLENARLSAQGLLAEDYFALRANDAQQKLLRDTVAEYQRFYQLTLNQYRAGTVSRANVLSAQTQLLAAQATLTDDKVGRAQDEHAIAMLIGVAPADLTIAPTDTLTSDVPVAPVALPSVLLQRRPDIAAAERRVESANAEIGVNEAAFYPDLEITGSVGQAATSFGRLFNAASNLWSVGGTLSEEVLDWGARRAAVRAAAANRDAAVATYRQTVLTAFQGVEDELAALHYYQGEAAQRQATADAARQAYQLSLNEYRAGIVDYTTVITAAATYLADQQQVLTVQQERLQASAVLIQNLGGGWDARDLPKS
jgi:NodT family efflux transporter outer membrane factor (OMF) lipoprotein